MIVDFLEPFCYYTLVAINWLIDIILIIVDSNYNMWVLIAPKLLNYAINFICWIGFIECEQLNAEENVTISSNQTQESVNHYIQEIIHTLNEKIVTDVKEEELLPVATVAELSFFEKHGYLVPSIIAILILWILSCCVTAYEEVSLRERTPERKLKIINKDLEKYKNLVKDSMCCICCEEKSKILMLPCKHLCLCTSCFEKIRKNQRDTNQTHDCPLCRRKVDNYWTVFN